LVSSIAWMASIQASKCSIVCAIFVVWRYNDQYPI
jgi:hypothetical protein